VHFKLLLGAWLRLLRENGRHIAPSKFGRAAAISAASAVHSLLNLLQDAVYRDAFEQVPVPASPIFLIGHWRSGTTLLHELLCLDAGHAYANTHACMNPSHFLISERALQGSRAGQAQAKRPMDNMTVTLASPQEDEFALFALGAPSPYVHWMFPADLQSHPEYFELDGLPRLERERWKSIFLTFLKQVLSRSRGRPVIKSPPHTFRVKILREMFPDAVFIHIVRDPYVLFASTRHLLERMFDIYALTRYEAAQLEEYILRNGITMEKALDAALPGLGRDRYHRVRYEDLVDSPIGQISLIYERLSLGDVEAVLPAIRAYLERNAGYQTNRFQLSRDDEARVSERWRGMFSKYGYALRA
jgi:hypothetical protein